MPFLSKVDKEKAKAISRKKERIEELERKKKDIAREKKNREKKEKKQRLKEEEIERKKEEFRFIQSTQMSVPIMDILKGVIITRDKRYLKVLEFMPQNFLMFSNADRNRIYDSFLSMLRVVPAKVQFKVFSRKAKTDSLMKVMSTTHKDERNPACRRMQEEYMQLVEDTALREGVSRRFLVIIEYVNTVNTDGTNFNEIVASLNQTAYRIRSHLEAAGNTYVDSCEKDQDLTALFYEILNRRASEAEPFSQRATLVHDRYVSCLKEQGISGAPVIPATEFISPAWIDFTHPRHIVVDKKFYTFGYIRGEGFPNYVITGWMSSFINACEGVDVDIFFSKVPREKVETKIGRQIRNNRAKLKETSDTSTEASSVENLIQSGFYLLNGIANGEDFFNVNVLITVTADDIDLLNYRYNEIEKMAETMGIKMRRTIFQMEEAFMSALPLCNLDSSLARKSKRNMLSGGAASMYPFISFELQDPNGIMLGVNNGNNSLVAVDVFDTSRHANANGAILGKSGYGKTFTAQLLAIRMRLQNIQTFIITPLKGREDYKRACDQIDGQYIALGPGSEYSINIFDIRVPDTEGLETLDGYDSNTSLLAKKVQDLHTFMHIVIKELSQEEEQMLDGYIYKVYEKFGITEDNNSLFIEGTNEYKKFPLIGDLYDEIIQEPRLQRVATILYPLVKGSLSCYNRPTNVDLDNKYIVFDMNGIKDQNLIMAMFITLDFVWSKIKENRLAKKAVFIDEAWQLIGKQSNEMTAEYVKEIFKTIRAFGGSAFVMTQEISDFFSLKDGEYGKAIIGNSDTKICLHLDSPEADTAREMMGLTDEEYKNIKKLQKGNGLVITGNSKLFVEFKASDFEVGVITTDPNYLRKKMKEEQKRKSFEFAESIDIEAPIDEVFEQIIEDDKPKKENVILGFEDDDYDEEDNFDEQKDYC